MRGPVEAEQTYSTVDKSSWGPGPWQDEPDKVQFVDEATGLPCLIKRHPTQGHLCGYVGVSEDHPSFGQDYGEVRGVDEDGDPGWIDVHGSLTYADACEEGDEATSICHIPAPGEPDHVWWFGFDCGHSFDLSPGRAALERERYEKTGDSIWLPLAGETYRTVEFVRAQCARLARQLASVA